MGSTKWSLFLIRFIRADKIISGRNGLKEVTAHRLDTIRVLYDTDTIRNYVMYYKDGSNQRTLLCGIAEFAGPMSEYLIGGDRTLIVNCNGIRTEDESHTYYYTAYEGIRLHTFDYYKEDQPGFSAPQLLNPANHSTSETPKLLGTDHDPKNTLSASTSTSGSTSLGVNFGLGVDVNSKRNSIGGAINGGYGVSKTNVTFMDINGDGLPDRVYHENGDYYYRPMVWSAGQPVLGPNVYRLYLPGTLGRERTWDGGIGVNGLVFPVGGSAGYNRSSTRIIDYFVDVNGDGLPDIVKNRVVYFSQLNADGSISFIQPTHDIVYFNNDSCKYIIYDGEVMLPEPVYPGSDFGIPMWESVRLWIAQHAGNIELIAPIQLIEDTSYYRRNADEVDGVFFRIQHNDQNTLWDDSLSAENYTPKDFRDTIHVNKGDRLYFRLHSNENRSFDNVSWSPVISYIDMDYDNTIDANNLKTYQFDAAEDFWVGSRHSYHTPDSGNILVSGQISHLPVSDTVWYQLKRDGVIVWTDSVQPHTIATITVDTILENFSAGEPLGLFAFSKSSIDPRQISHNIRFEYTWAESLTIDPNSLFNQIVHLPQLQFSLWQNMAISAPPALLSPGQPVIVTPGLAGQTTTMNGSITLTAKTTNQLLARETYTLVNGSFPQNAELSFNLTNQENVYFEYFSDSASWNGLINNAFVTFNNNSYKASFYTPIHDTMWKFGHLERGWGQFTYLGVITTEINEATLYIPSQFAGQIGNVVDSANLTSIFDTTSTNLLNAFNTLQNQFQSSLGCNPLEWPFSPMYPDMDSNVYRGGFQNTMVAANRMSNEQRRFTFSFVDDDPFEYEETPNRPIKAIKKVIVQNTGVFDIDYRLIFDKTQWGVAPGISVSTGNNKTLSDFMDMNGDGFPDIIVNESIQYTTPHGGLDVGSVQNLSDDVNNSCIFSIGGNAGLTSPTIQRANTKASGNTRHLTKHSGTASGSGSRSRSESQSLLIDVNGDGLPDELSYNKNLNIWYVRLNIGYGFTEAEKIDLENLYKSISYNYSSSIGWGGGELEKDYDSWKAGIGGSLSNNKQVFFPADVNGDGLVDILRNESNNQIHVAFNTGTGFMPFIAWSQDTIAAKSQSINYNGNVAGTMGIPFLGAKTTGTLSLGGSASFTTEKSQFIDVNNDGYPDIVYWDDDELKVKYSTMGRINILKHVNTPALGSYHLNYELMKSDVDMPQRKWVLSEVVMKPDTSLGYGADSMLTRFAYKNGYYDRFDREFFGYDSVITTQYQTWPGTYAYRTTVETFYNRDCLFKGLKTSEALLDSTGSLLVRTEYTWHRKEITTGNIVPDSMAHCYGPYYPAISAEDRFFYEGLQNHQIHTRKEYVHGPHGNIVQYTNLGDVVVAGDSIVATITYYIDSAKNILGLPDTLVVTDGTNELRKRYATYNPQTGRLTRIEQVNGANSSRIDIAYYANGNLSSIFMPSDYSGYRKRLYYGYDAATSTYPTWVSDDLGYVSETFYDLRFGVPLQTTDVSGNVINFTYDRFGRMKTVRAPYEADQGTPWTIKFEFWDMTNHPADSLVIPWAQTLHYDTMNPGNHITTTTFADGLGRALQTKKSSVVYENGQAALTNVVSGKVIYDGLGRTVRAYHPTTDTTNALIFSTVTDTIPPTIIQYDALDRQRAVWFPEDDNTYLSNLFEYGFDLDLSGNKRFTTTVTDANNITSVQYTDPRGLQTKVTAAGMATTQFVYNAMGELIESIDPEDNPTTYTYDMFGRVTQRNHPDAGITSWQYDGAGNLRTVQTANLAASGQHIYYNYFQGRLSHIQYPLNPEMDVYYEYGDNSAGNQAGRITRMQDASGVQQFFYGKLGEITRNERTFVMPGDPRNVHLCHGIRIR
jgi:YD repeat-containing protein